jgi:hypothetical protein
MLDALGSALTGLQAAQRQHDVFANNIANAAVFGGQPSELSQADGQNPGQTAVPTGDLAGNLVGLDMAVFGFRANVVTAKTAQDAYSAILEMGK